MAGDDYFTKDFCKGLLQTKKGPLLYSVLKSRPWINNLSDLIFICLDSEMSRSFFKKYIKKWFPKSKIVFLSNKTSGAAFSLLAGLSIASNKGNEPIIIDLADIYFETNFVPYDEFADFGYVFAFKSKGDQYSYFELGEDMQVKKAVEKEQISNFASAGVYTFPSCSMLLKALAYALENSEKITYNNLFYVCPIMNYLINEDTEVKLIMVENQFDYKV